MSPLSQKILKIMFYFRCTVFKCLLCTYGLFKYFTFKSYRLWLFLLCFRKNWVRIDPKLNFWSRLYLPYPVCLTNLPTFSLQRTNKNSATIAPTVVSGAVNNRHNLFLKIKKFSIFFLKIIWKKFYLIVFPSSGLFDTSLNGGNIWFL